MLFWLNLISCYFISRVAGEGAEGAAVAIEGKGGGFLFS